MFKSIFAIAFVVAVSAGPMMGGGMGPGGPGGPMKDLENGLSDAQKQQLQAIFKDDSLTKQQMKDNLKTFFDGVGGDAAVSCIL
uniref:Uncharacterized protein n=1 Tax=Panagrolaimus sp. PS1159 TaxID=55785 RepID=A0AC35FY86_9BILA